MNSKKPIPIISPSQNEDLPDEVGVRVGWLNSFSHFQSKVAIALIAYGLLSVMAAVFCLRSALDWISTSTVPLLIFAIAFIWLGILVWRYAQAGLKLAHDDSAPKITQHDYLNQIQQLISLLHLLRRLGAIALLIGICGIILACTIEALTYSTAIWLATTLQAGLFSVAVLMLTFRLEIHAHEMSRER